MAVLFLILGLPGGSPARAETVAYNAPTSNSTDSTAAKISAPRPKYRGWDYLVNRLVSRGTAENELARIYRDPRMPRFTEIPFSLEAKEPKSIYAGFTTHKRLSAARKFLKKHDATFRASEKRFQVNRHVIAAILSLESGLGHNTGRHTIVNRLSRLASIAEPGNVKANYRRHVKTTPGVTLEMVAARAQRLEEMFMPEIPALIKISKERRIDPFAVRGSISGAFGMPQFLPSSYLRFGLDGNKNGVVSLFEEPDAIWSTAHYLASFGWNNSAFHEDHRKVIWHYNHSDPYIDTVLEFAAALSNRRLG